ncbi:hypothetical protein [Neptuniibacter sp.]|uniref:hypothetical protein n=1 Tax=Neptuniibacter sp. TaxID=1962643 RepID=UPI002634F977|nr:hypothetical protein [Neptuniibacter sp.]MCP4595394.1 ParA family protein [Neptuniibacter sp.]
MKYLVTSIKGGVGKSSIGLNLAMRTGSQYITNDITPPAIEDVIQIPINKKKIPADLAQLENAVFDLGALSTLLDPKIAHAASFCDVIIIPTRTDARSVAATLKTYELLQDAGKPIVIIINHFTDERKRDTARDRLWSALGRIPIFSMKNTTLFDRVSADGIDWYLNVLNIWALHTLHKTIHKHNDIYDRITAIGGRG